MTTETASQAAPSPVESWRMFDRIAGRYDLLNRILSGGTDIAWRRRLARMLPDRSDLRLLDMATGTGDVMLMMHGLNGNLAEGVGMDMSAEMLGIGRRKIAERQLADRFRMVRCDAECIAAPSESFDAVTIAFGIRNVPGVQTALNEMHRVLKPGGRALVLEFSLPSNAIFRALYLFYFRNVLPRIGALVSGDAYAYSYLNQSAEHFPYGDAFLELMRQAGFESCQAQPLTFGIATIYQGDKPC